MIRRYIRNSPLLYPLYTRFVLQNEQAVFPTPTTQLHFTGFPRSANTYCRHLIDVAFPDMNIVSHIHTTASLKLALRYCIPTLILLREPVPACCSLALKRQEVITTKVIGRLFREYLDYYQYVLAHKERLPILRFQDVVESPEYVIRTVAKYLELSLENTNIQDIVNVAQCIIEEKVEGMPDEGSSLPNEVRQKMKASLECQFLDHHLCDSAVALHKSVALLQHG